MYMDLVMCMNLCTEQKRNLEKQETVLVIGINVGVTIFLPLF